MSVSVNSGNSYVQDDASSIAQYLPETSLLLPYDKLKSPAIGYRREALDILIDPDKIGYYQNATTLVSNPDAAFFIAACAALFYRYSNQLMIPLFLVESCPDSWKLVYKTIQQTVSGEQLFGELVQLTKASISHGEQISLAICVDSPNKAHDIPVLIDLTQLTANCESASAGATLDCTADLQIKLQSLEQQLKISFIYNGFLFNAKRIKQLSRHLANILCSAVPQSAVRDLLLLTDKEKRWLADQSQGKTIRYQATPIHQTIEQHAIETPDKIAVEFKDGTLTYRQLNLRANRLANYLLALGVRAESRVGVFIEPGSDIAVCLLAIFKLGATYVPLEPAYPDARIKMICDEVQPLTIITEKCLSARMEALKVTHFCLEQWRLTANSIASQSPDVSYSAERVAYIFYTSGTTGKPKGILASYANLQFYLRAAQYRYGYGPEDRIPAVARFTFSISLFELLSPLLAGGTLLVLPRARILDPSQMVLILQTVSAAHIGPTLLKVLTQHLDVHPPKNGSFTNLRHLSSGGDMIPPELLAKLRGYFPSSELFVIYGCSEISCMGTTWFIPPEHHIVRTFVGQPFANAGVVVVDENDLPLPSGVVGDVCFTGDGVVKGYLNRPQLNAEKFFQLDGKRYYRTGDRGRWDSEGQLELLGRLDFQIKLHGMRIELAELEYHLRQVDGVKDGVITCRETCLNEKLLVAFYVPDPLKPASAQSIRHQLSKILPDYMVPTVYQPLDQLPLNHNLKLDRKALPDIDRQAPKVDWSAAMSTLEFLTQWCCSNLLIKEASCDDNFFELGGDSFLAMNLIAEIDIRYGKTISGMDIMRESLAVLAMMIDCRSIDDSEHQKLATKIKAIIPFETCYFGRNNDLFGVFHPPQIDTGKPPVILFSPLAREQRRSYFFLRFIAERLAKKGFPVFRFDYFATGDSGGQDTQASVARWQADQLDAIAYLASRVPGKKPIAIAARMSAALLLSQAQALPLTHLILWDPLVDLKTHFEIQQQIHQIKVSSLFHLKGPWFVHKLARATQIWGVSYAPETLHALTALTVGRHQFEAYPSLDWLVSEEHERQQQWYDQFSSKVAKAKFYFQDAPCQWYAALNTDDGINNPPIARTLISLVQKALR